MGDPARMSCQLSELVAATAGTPKDRAAISGTPGDIRE